MDNKKMTKLSDDMLDVVSGGALGFSADGQGTFTMKCEYSGQVFYGVSLANGMEISKYCASVPNTPEGENEIIAWALSMGYIH